MLTLHQSTEYNVRTISKIALEIEADWKKISPYAKPYLEAMKTLNTIADKYFLDSGHSVVLYFLANSGTWKGETARRIKKELKEIAK